MGATRRMISSVTISELNLSGINSAEWNRRSSSAPPCSAYNQIFWPSGECLEDLAMAKFALGGLHEVDLTILPNLSDT